MQRGIRTAVFIDRHEPNCMKVQKKRKVFDPSKQRATEDLSLRQIKQAQKKDLKPKKSNWRKQHEEFVNNIRCAKQAQVAIDKGGPLPPPPPPAENPDYVTCQYCQRRFNEKAADRHISFCKEQQKRLPLKAKREPTAQEKARAAATKYQPPKPKVRGQPADSPSYSDGNSRGGYSNTPPSSRGGGYSNAPPGRAGARQEPNRAPAGGTGYGGRGRAGPAGGAGSRGRPSPSQPTYQASDYADYDSHSDFDPDEIMHGNGRALRTGRDAHAYEEARRDVRGHNPVPRTKATRGMGASRVTATKTSGPMGRTGDSGYYSNNSEGDGSSYNKPSRGNNTPKFCHECGNKYPVEDAKFCCECGIRRMGVTVR